LARERGRSQFGIEMGRGGKRRKEVHFFIKEILLVGSNIFHMVLHVIIITI